MGEADSRRVIRPRPRSLGATLPDLLRSKPRSYLEWKTLRRWDALPGAERRIPGFLLRLARERAGLTQREMAARLGCSQQAISQAERWDSNPTVEFLEGWVRAAGQELVLDLLNASPSSG